MDQLPQELQRSLEEADQETLEAAIDFAEARLAEVSSETADDDGVPTEPPEAFEGDEEQWADAIESCEAPGRATLTTKQINGNQYLYWQWSENGATKSEYIAPKNPK